MGSSVVERRILESRALFMRQVWAPYLSTIMGGSVHSIEGQRAEALLLLDYSGADYLWFHHNGPAHCLAVRVHTIPTGRKPEQTMTVRYQRPGYSGEVEYQKMARAAAAPPFGAIVPVLYLQPYVEKGTGKMVCCGVTRYLDLYHACRREFDRFGESWVRIKVNPEDQVRFFSMPFGSLRRQDIEVVVIKAADIDKSRTQMMLVGETAIEKLRAAIGALLCPPQDDTVEIDGKTLRVPRVGFA